MTSDYHLRLRFARSTRPTPPDAQAYGVQGDVYKRQAVSDAPAENEAAKEFVRRVKKASDADGEASGSTRIAGSLNFKTCLLYTSRCV